MKTRDICKRCTSSATVLSVAIGLAVLAVCVTAQAKSVYLATDHHSQLFDAWNLNPGGTVTKQGTYNLQYSTDPAGVAIYEDAASSLTTLFITSEFSPGVEMVDPDSLTYLGVVGSPLPSNLAGIDIDDATGIVYTIRRMSSQLYILQFNPVGRTLSIVTSVSLPNCSSGFGLRLDETRRILWVADAAGRVRAYNVNVSTWSEISEIPSLTYDPGVHDPIDVAVDRKRNLVYTVSIIGGASRIGTGSYHLTKRDVATGTLTSVNMGFAGVGVAVDEITGLVYVTGGAYTGDNLSVWDTTTTPFTKIQDTGKIGNPAGIAIGNVSYNPLNLAKNGIVQGIGIGIGETFTYTITCDNVGNSVPVSNVRVVDTLPPQLDYFGSAVNGVSDPASVYDPVTHTVNWSLGTIPAGGAGPHITLDVRVNGSAVPGSTIYNQATIDSDQTPPTTVEDSPGPGQPPGNPVVPLGDLDHDGDVDGADRNVLRASLGASTGDPRYNGEADYDGDSVITYLDYKLWYNHYKAYVASLP